MISRNDIKQLINKVEAAMDDTPSILFTQELWIYELQRNPDYFWRNDDGQFMYMGFNVVVVGDDKQFIELADKMLRGE